MVVNTIHRINLYPLDSAIGFANCTCNMYPLNASIREVTLTGLDKNTEYKIMLFANTSKGGGNESEPVTVKMDGVYHCTGYYLSFSYGMQYYPNLN